MGVEDLRSIDLGQPIEADLCIVGSGPAGWSIAEALRGSGLRVLMLESGGLGIEDASEALNRCEMTGVPLSNGRARVLGGASKLWFGRCIPFDDIDYEARPWVPRSGWPITGEAMAPHLAQASAFLGVVPHAQLDGSPPALPGLRPQPQVDPDLLENECWSNPKILDFGQILLTRPYPELRVIAHATVTHINTDPASGQLQSLEIARPDGTRGLVAARAAVLCAGGVENARILLYSNRVEAAGVGNRHDVVGRYFMDHPRDYELIAHVDLRHRHAFRHIFGPNMVDTPIGRCEFSHGFKLSADYQRRHGLMNAAAWFYEVLSEDDPLEALRRLKRRQSGSRAAIMRDAWWVASQPGPVIAGVQKRLTRQRVLRKIDKIGFLVSSEQTPDPESRVQLSELRDWLGLPISRVDWRIGQQERASQAALARLIAAEFQRLGLPPVILADWVVSGHTEKAAMVDGCHPTGATRMSADPRQGVVDANCQVHGVDGLYIAGSSVFPTAGHANPTLMIVALAVRLAHELRQRLSRPDQGARPLVQGAAPVETTREMTDMVHAAPFAGAMGGNARVQAAGRAGR